MCIFMCIFIYTYICILRERKRAGESSRKLKSGRGHVRKGFRNPGGVRGRWAFVVNSLVPGAQVVWDGKESHALTCN